MIVNDRGGNCGWRWWSALNARDGVKLNRKNKCVKLNRKNKRASLNDCNAERMMQSFTRMWRAKRSRSELRLSWRTVEIASLKASGLSTFISISTNSHWFFQYNWLIVQYNWLIFEYNWLILQYNWLILQYNQLFFNI